MYNQKVVVLRARKGVPGVGKKLSRNLQANEVTCKSIPTTRIPNGAMILNYGRSQTPVWAKDATSRGCFFMNKPSGVKNCVDKLRSLRKLWADGVPALEFCDNKDQALEWLHAGNQVIVRHTTVGKKGEGVECVNPQQYLPEAPLYTKFYDKSNEFRVHIVNGKVIDYVQKKRMGKKKLAKLGLEKANRLLRNHKQGWIFAHSDILRDGRKAIETMALQAAHSLGIDYCGVDVLARYDEDGTFIDARVCEVNSAPGMSSPTTFQRYIEAFTQAMVK